MNLVRSALLAAFAGSAALSSAMVFHVTQDLSALPINTYTADFALTGGGVVPNSTALVTLTNLTFAGFIPYYQGTNGDVTTTANGFRLADGPTNGYGEAFVLLSKMGSAASVSFDVETTSTSDFSTDDDFFLYRLLDSSQSGTIATTGPFGDGFLGIDLDRQNTVFERYADVSGYRLPMVQISTVTPPVPEPATVAAFGLGALGLLRRRRVAGRACRG